MSVQIEVTKSEISTPNPKETPDLLRFEFVGEFLGATPIQHDLLEFLSNHQAEENVTAVIGRLPNGHDGISLTVDGSLSKFQEFMHLRDLRAKARAALGSAASEAEVEELFQKFVSDEAAPKLAAQVDAAASGENNGQPGQENE